MISVACHKKTLLPSGSGGQTCVGLLYGVRPKKKDSCVQVSEVKKIRVGRSKNIFILDFFFITNVQRL